MTTKLYSVLSTSSVQWVSIDTEVCLLLQWLRELLLAFPILHTDTLKIELATWAMDHVSLNSVMKLWLQMWMQNFCRHQMINIFSCSWFVRICEKQNHVCMWQTFYLNLNGVYNCRNMARSSFSFKWKTRLTMSGLSLAA